jgi:DNA-binding transcriptional ArsR family regulator
MATIEDSVFKDEAPPTLYELDDIEQIQAITAPVRYRMLVLLAEKAMTAAQLARALHITRQRAYYHLKVLEKNRLARFVGEQRVGEMFERYYRTYGFIHSYRALVDRFYTTRTQPEINRLLKAINNFALTIINEAHDNMLQQDFMEHFQLSYQFDSPLLLTREQAEALRGEIIELCRRFLEIDHQNRIKEEPEHYIRVRNSIFLSPVPKEFLEMLGQDQPSSTSGSEPQHAA